jgi:hypothetical protein
MGAADGRFVGLCDLDKASLDGINRHVAHKLDLVRVTDGHTVSHKPAEASLTQRTIAWRAF